VWRLQNGQRHAVGIHTNGASTGNSATRITSPVFNNIKKWKAEGL
jgi:V8-like Glu-specific endopeptidase